jgi:hypothetical protein
MEDKVIIPAKVAHEATVQLESGFARLDAGRVEVLAAVWEIGCGAYTFSQYGESVRAIAKRADRSRETVALALALVSAFDSFADASRAFDEGLRQHGAAPGVFDFCRRLRSAQAAGSQRAAGAKRAVDVDKAAQSIADRLVKQYGAADAVAIAKAVARLVK